MRNVYTMAVDTTVRIVDGIADRQLRNRTPCDGFTVATELNHLYLAVGNVVEVAHGRDVDLSRRPDLLVGDWRAGFADAAMRMAETLSRPVPPDGPVSNMGLTREQVAELAVSELLIHGWDLAIATGQDFRPHPEVVDHVRRFHHGDRPNDGIPPGSFAAPVPVPSDASPLERLLGGLGRDPRWSATSSSVSDET